MKNNYGNYVVQKALRLSKGMHKNKLISTILKNLEKIGDRKLIMKWKSIVDSHVSVNENESFNYFMNQNNSFQIDNRSMKPLSPSFIQEPTHMNQSFNMNNRIMPFYQDQQFKNYIMENTPNLIQEVPHRRGKQSLTVNYPNGQRNFVPQNFGPFGFDQNLNNNNPNLYMVNKNFQGPNGFTNIFNANNMK
jgi:hypothetical protein